MLSWNKQLLYFAKWRMDVEKESSVDVITAEFAEVSFIPTDKWIVKQSNEWS